MADSYGPCLIDECDNRRRKRSPLCEACSRSINGYWLKRIVNIGAHVVRDRQKALAKWQTRMRYLGGLADQPRRVVNATNYIPKR
jgi:hypothetical protein